MTTLRLVLDRLVSPGVDGDGRYAENLAREIAEYKNVPPRFALS